VFPLSSNREFRPISSQPCTDIRARGQRIESIFHECSDQPVCTENLIRVDDVMESPKLAE
jgi:hypothetical protein